MRRSISLIVKGKMNSDIEVEDELTPKEILQELSQNHIINLDDSYINNAIVRLLVSEQVISVDTQLDFAKVYDNEIIYIEQRGV